MTLVSEDLTLYQFLRSMPQGRIIEGYAKACIAMVMARPTEKYPHYQTPWLRVTASGVKTVHQGPAFRFWAVRLIDNYDCSHYKLSIHLKAGDNVVGIDDHIEANLDSQLTDWVWQALEDNDLLEIADDQVLPDEVDQAAGRPALNQELVRAVQSYRASTNPEPVLGVAHLSYDPVRAVTVDHMSYGDLKFLAFQTHGQHSRIVLDDASEDTNMELALELEELLERVRTVIITHPVVDKLPEHGRRFPAAEITSGVLRFTTIIVGACAVGAGIGVLLATLRLMGAV